MSKLVIILNGPPNTGKDVGARHLVEFLQKLNIPASHAEFKKKLIALTQIIWDVDSSTWDFLYTRELKEVPSKLFGGMSPRQALIHTSETVVKPNYGQRYFGESASRVLQEGFNIFSDGGFTEELIPLQEYVGYENVLVVRLHRPDCDYSGDSRSYLPDTSASSIVDLYNHGDESEYFSQLEEVVLQWLKKNES